MCTPAALAAKQPHLVHSQAAKICHKQFGKTPRLPAASLPSYEGREIQFSIAFRCSVHPSPTLVGPLPLSAQ